MIQRRQFIQAAAITPFAIAATPYRAKPSWYLEPEERSHDLWYHRGLKRKVSLQDPSVDWTQHPKHQQMVSLSVSPYRSMRTHSMVKSLASSHWDFKVDLNVPVPVAVDRRMITLTVAELLEYQNPLEHPALQHGPVEELGVDEIYAYNGFQPRAPKVGDVVKCSNAIFGFTQDVLRIEGDDIYCSDVSIGYLCQTSFEYLRTKPYWIIPDSLPSKGRQLQYGDIVIPTLSAHRSRHPKEDAFHLRSQILPNNTFSGIHSDDLIYLGQDPRPRVIYDSYIV